MKPAAREIAHTARRPAPVKVMRKGAAAALDALADLLNPFAEDDSDLLSAYEESRA